MIACTFNEIRPIAKIRLKLVNHFLKLSQPITTYVTGQIQNEGIGMMFKLIRILAL